MEATAAVRRAARAAVADVEPADLRERIDARLADAALAPGVLTVESARAVGTDVASADATGNGDAPDSVHEPALERAAAVQLVYEGLALTRDLSQDDPWGGEGDRDAADLAIIVADVLVARGFQTLARTEVASDAVEVVRTFGHDQTRRRETGDATIDWNLEADVLALAVTTGTTAVGGDASGPIREFADELAAGGLPAVDRITSEATRERLASFTTRPTGAPEQAAPAAED